MTQVKAQLNNLRISPRKVMLVAAPLRGKTLHEALAVLDYDIRKSGAIIAKLLRSAQANATNNFKIEEKDLVVQDILVGAGPTMKRWRPRAYGRASKILKRTSRVTVLLTDGLEGVSDDKPAPQKKVAPKKAAKKAPAKKTTAKKVVEKSGDDLTKIEGIGPKIAEALAGAQMTTFDLLSKTTAQKITEVIADVRGTHDPTSWPQQAKLAASEKWDELATLQEELIGGKKQ